VFVAEIMDEFILALDLRRKWTCDATYYDLAKRKCGQRRGDLGPDVRGC
jgi:hypothetical protein